MAKKLIHDYTFDASANTVVINYVYKPERLLLITNLTDGITIYLFNSATLGYSSVSYDYDAETTTIVLNYDCSSMSDSDELQIFVEQDFQSFEPSETFIDPVSKIRVSQPENLIDTDFEYGLQSTKWETLELVKNIPTFFSRSGDSAYDVSDITTIQDGDIVTVSLNEAHNLLSGSPVIVQGTTSVSCDGTFVVTAIPSTTSFTYKAKSLQTSTGSIYDPISTQIFPGSRYQGTEFTLSNIDTIITDANQISTLTVTTQFPTGFVENTSFYLTNSVSPITLFANSELVTVNLTVENTQTVTNNVATGETGFSLGATQPYNYGGSGTGSNEAVYFNIADCTVDTGPGVETLTFPSPHGLTDNKWYLYVVGEDNTVIGGLSNYVAYNIRVVDANTIYFTTATNSTTRINLTSAGTNGGIMRSSLLRAWRMNGADGRSSREWVGFTENITNALPTRDIPLAFFNGTASNFAVSTNLISPTIYFRFDRPSTTLLRFSSSPTGGLIRISSSSATGVMVPLSLLSDRKSIYFADHGYETNDLVTFSVVSGTPPTGLVSGNVYQVQKVNDNRIQFLDPTTSALVSFTSSGGASEYSVTTRSLNNFADTIFITEHELSDGTALVYSNTGNTTIGGLTDATTYYVFQSTPNHFKLATNSTGWAAGAISFTQNGTNVNLALNRITLPSAHGYSSGDFVQYISNTPIGNLSSGFFYYVNAVSATVVTLHFTVADAIAGTNIIDLYGSLSGTGSLRKSNLVDITSIGSGIHSFSATSAGASDGVFRLANNISSNTFTLEGNVQIGNRILQFDANTDIDLSRSALRYESHSLAPGTSVVYSNTGGTEIGGLTADTTYYVVRVSRDWIKLADSAQNALISNTITLTSVGTDIHTLTTSTVTGESLGSGSVSIAANSKTVIGSDTKFGSIFVSGDSFTIYAQENTASKAVSSIDTGTDIITTSASHGLSNGAPVRMSATAAPGGTTNDYIYYIQELTATTLSLHPTPADAEADTNKIDITDAGSSVNLVHISDIGNTFTSRISTINGTTELNLLESPTSSFTDAEYVVSTGLFVRADGFAIHRPYDGGVELIPSTNPDSTMIRQTRKYFRYQSGKGIQVSFAVNFSPSTTIDTMSWSANGGGNIIATVTTRYSHRISPDSEITVSGATVSSGINYWNGSFTVIDTPTPSSFTVELSGQPQDSVAQGIVDYYLNGWSNCLLKCGMFDDQNGLYFEYNGSELFAVRRSSTLQISGTATVQFKNGAVIGTNTKFTSQLSVGEFIVIKGQTYKITEITNDSLFYILPSYRGVDATNVIITKTIDTKVPQSQWNIDKADGTGPSGFFLDIHKIHMAYMDYSWYGAGKVRFGFKDQRGKVIYCHEFIHNNKQTEAYMRSGNLPARYEIENLGQPSYVPALAHWGTSIIMDGQFDDDRAYVFTAGSQPLSLTGSSQIVANASIETTSEYFILQPGTTRTYLRAGFALKLDTTSSTLNSIVEGMPISGANLSETTARNPRDVRLTPTPYQPGVQSRIGFSSNGASTLTRDLLIISNQPSSTAGSSGYTITLSEATSSIVYLQPLISIRLAPSVDNGAPGSLGSREIINRMQLILNSVGILTTHAVEVELLLNGTLTNYNWQRVTNPSLSQLVYHSTNDRIEGGTIVYSFRAQGGTGTTDRTPVITQQELGEIATLGNSILGGDNTFPDGPDVLTVVVKLVEDPGTVTNLNPFNINGRISWSESQA